MSTFTQKVKDKLLKATEERQRVSKLIAGVALDEFCSDSTNEEINQLAETHQSNCMALYDYFLNKDAAYKDIFYKDASFKNLVFEDLVKNTQQHLKNVDTERTQLKNNISPIIAILDCDTNAKKRLCRELKKELKKNSLKIRTLIKVILVIEKVAKKKTYKSLWTNQPHRKRDRLNDYLLAINASLRSNLAEQTRAKIISKLIEKETEMIIPYKLIRQRLRNMNV